ncbi:Glycoside hydrolase superfamily [Phytophthora cactorum]|nr:Glycoside hydrolase superfamily [Phytophthora cactorum]
MAKLASTKDNGLGYFDKVVAAAKAAGVKLVVPYVYVKQLGGKYHDDFYTNEKIKAHTRSTSPHSEPLQELGPNHLVATGSEGFLNTDSSVYLYSGLSGVDFDANLAIKSIDYGAYHTYPATAGVSTPASLCRGARMDQNHVASGKKAGKPVVMEEYGVKSQQRQRVRGLERRCVRGRLEYAVLGVRTRVAEDVPWRVHHLRHGRDLQERDRSCCQEIQTRSSN